MVQTGMSVTVKSVIPSTIFAIPEGSHFFIDPCYVFSNHITSHENAWRDFVAKMFVTKPAITSGEAVICVNNVDYKIFFSQTKHGDGSYVVTTQHNSCRIGVDAGLLAVVSGTFAKAMGMMKYASTLGFAFQGGLETFINDGNWSGGLECVTGDCYDSD